MSFEPKLSVTGLGYGGLPLAMVFSKAWPLWGFDTDQARVLALQDGHDWTGQYETIDILGARIHFTFDPKQLRSCNFHLIAVPTQLNEADQPDLGPLMRACRTVGSFLTRGDIVVFISTVSPGTTEEICLPELEEASGLIGGVDFKLGYSPNRIDPGQRQNTLLHTPRLIAAEDEDTLDIIEEVFSRAIKAPLHRTGTIAVAEAAKVLEVTQLDLNHALMNEMAIILDRMDISGHEVIAAASSNPAFKSYLPGLNSGRYNAAAPYYLAQRSLALGYTPQVIQAGRQVNDHMSRFVAAKCIKELVKAGQRVLGARVTLLGLTLAPGSSDLRHTKLNRLTEELEDFGLDLQLHDPIADPKEVKIRLGKSSCSFEQLEPANALILMVAHQEYKDISADVLLGLLEPRAAVIDLTGTLDPKPLIAKGHRCWGL
ncbi:MAG: nucleotide sugar dehydrogenase [bacterium]|nr:nucleotide sugar dehydrogenase [bacterium]